MRWGWGGEVHILTDVRPGEGSKESPYLEINFAWVRVLGMQNCASINLNFFCVQAFWRALFNVSHLDECLTSLYC